jgi:hypothetical protein
MLGYGIVPTSQMDLLDALAELIEQILEVAGIGGKIRVGTIYVCFDNCHRLLSSQQR